MVATKSKEVHIIKHPVGLPEKSDFAIVETEIPPLKENQILIRNHFFSVDPYMRGRMNDRKSYIPGFQLNQPMSGGSAGEVVESNNPAYHPGDYVYGFGAWREYFTSDGVGLSKIDPKLAPIQSYLSTLGMTGFTAYIGLIEVGQLKEKETVFVSAAAGAVGSMVCQIAKMNGCKVIASAGSDEKIKWLVDELGVDGAINYKTVDNLQSELAEVCPGGIDVYFDNVGGSTLDAALYNMNTFGRVVVCGMISQYNKIKPDPLYNFGYGISNRLRIEGFIITDFYDQFPEFLKKMGKWVTEGKIKQKETVIEGIEQSVDAFLGLFSGKNIGKMVVKI